MAGNSLGILEIWDLIRMNLFNESIIIHIGETFFDDYKLIAHVKLYLIKHKKGNFIQVNRLASTFCLNSVK